MRENRLSQIHRVPNLAPVDLAPHYDRDAIVRDYWNEEVASEIVLPIAPLNDNDSDLQEYEYECAFGLENNEDALSFFIGEYDQNYYYDSANEDDIDSDTHFIPHGMVFSRKHNRIFEQIKTYK